MSDAHLPYVFILDWDGTIAGKVDFQSARYSMVKTMTRYGYRVLQKNIPDAFMPGRGLIRPGFANFIKAMKEMYPNCMFFIYTASERQWAMQEIPWVEKSHGIQFQRPIFTRDDCTVDSTGNYRKKLQNIWPRIVRTMNARKGANYSKEEKEKILNERTIIIDNNAVYTDRQDRLLLCPDYNYMVFEDLLDGFPSQSFQNPAVQQHVLHLINEGLVCPYSISYHVPMHGEGGGAKNGGKKDPMTHMAKQYEWYAHKCKSIVDLNRKYQHDIFWPYLKKLIQKNNLKVYTRSILQQLQDAVWKRMRKISMLTSRTHHAPLMIAGNQASTMTQPQGMRRT